MPKRSRREQRSATYRERAVAAPINTPFAGLASLLPTLAPAPEPEPVVQRVERAAHNGHAAGSSPAGRAPQPARESRRDASVLHQTPTQPKHFTPGVDRTPIRTTNFDAVFASVPQSVVAARVVSGNGEHYEPDINYRERRHWESPPPMVPLKAMDGNTQAVARELIGK